MNSFQLQEIRTHLSALYALLCESPAGEVRDESQTIADTDSKNAMCLPGLLAAFLIPLDSLMSANAALFLVAFCAFAAPTNQIHQWAHMERAPLTVRWLQRIKLILSPDEHALHHRHPHVTRYCISSGVCNSVLDKISFFPC